jgi:hypothetical protein
VFNLTGVRRFVAKEEIAKAKVDARLVRSALREAWT